MALFRGIQEYIALDVNNINSRVEDEGNIVNISGNIFLYSPKKSHPILYKCFSLVNTSQANVCSHPIKMLWTLSTTKIN